MNLNDLFTDLALNELSNLSLVENDVLIPEKRPKIVSTANEALLALYTRFILKENNLLLEMREAQTNYHLLKRYAWSNYDPEKPPARYDMPYILDSISEPFEEDVIKVMTVHNTFGQKMPLNDTESPLSVFSPQSNTLQVPFPIPGQALSIEYQAKHAKLDHCDCDMEIELPDVLWRALKAYIAGRTYGNMNTQENTIKGQEHMLTYEAICQEVVDLDLVSNSTSTTNSRFEKRGFV